MKEAKAEKKFEEWIIKQRVRAIDSACGLFLNTVYDNGLSLDGILELLKQMIKHIEKEREIEI